ncbi:hypothetical protein DWG20_04570 [Crenobacter cavernae]|uniref:Autotransporter domain-containing protein n=1 Tax=Crenobacter cavernae TaxID=2290923 RepID=A0A345Y4B0_9NEIS|nr:hypothetical protein DWG20_04570 [Crenobacter cavernae]
MTYQLTKVGGKMTSVAVCALTGAVLFGASGAALAVPVVYFQTLAGGRTYFDNTVSQYAQGGTPNLISTSLSGLSAGTNWNANGISITPSNGASRTVDDTYLSNAPSLAGSPTGQGINMSAVSGAGAIGSGLTFNFGSQFNAFGIEMGDWGTCCYNSSLYIQFGNNGTWDTAQLIGTATQMSDVPESSGGRTFTFIGAINDTNFFDQVRIYGDGNGDVLYAGGTLRSASVELNSVPGNAGSSTQQPAATDIDTAQSHYLASKLGSTVNPAFEGGTLQIDSASPTISNDFTVANSGGTIDANGNSATFSGVIADKSGASGRLTFTGSGTTTLSGANTYSGGTTIGGGATVKVAADSALGAASGGLTLDNGTLASTATHSSARNIALAGNGTLDVAASTTLTENGVISGGGALSKTGSGTLVLGGSNANSGATNVNSGTLEAGKAGALSSASATTVASGATLDLNSYDQTVGSLAGAGHVTLGSANLNAGGDNSSTTFSGDIGGSGGLNKTGSGTLTLSGDNGYTGSTSIGSGATLALAGSGDIAESSGVANNGSFNIAATNSGATIKTLSGNGNVQLGGKTLTLSNANSTFVAGEGSDVEASGGFAGAIHGSGGVTVAGGTEILSGDNDYTGATTVDNGATLALAGDGNIAASSGLANNGTFDIANTHNGTTIETLSGNGAVQLGGKTLTLSQASGNFAGGIHGTGGLTVVGGTQTLSGSSDYSGGTTISGGATVKVAADAALGAADGGLTLNNGTLATTATHDSARAIALTGNGTFDVANATTLTENGTISGAGGLTKEGQGTLVLCGSDYTGSTTVNAGTLKACKADALAKDSAVTVAESATLDLDGHDQTIGSLAGAGDVALGSAKLTTGADNGSTTFSGDIAGTGGLSKTGSGTLTLSGDNGYSGATHVDGGTLKAGKAGALPQDSAVTVASGATLDLDGFDQSIGSLAGAGNVALGSANLNTGGDNGSSTFSGDIGGTGGLSKTGSGTLTLSGVNNYSGGTAINGGVVQIASNGALGAASGGLSLNNGTLKVAESFSTARDIALAGEGRLDVATGKALSSTGTVSGNGPLIKNGAGTLTLDGENTYHGGTVVNDGILQVASDAALGDASGDITLNGGTLQTTANMGTDRKITLLSNSQLLTDAGTTFTQNGGIDGSGRLFKAGTGTLVLTGTNTYSGGTTINGGDVQVADGSSLGTGTVLLNGGTLHTTETLAANQQVLVSGNSQARVDAGTTALLSGTISDGGSSGCFNKTGSGTLNMTGSATLNNGTCVQDGMLRANGALNSWVLVYAAGTLRGTGQINGDMTVNGTLAPGNSPGLLTQSGTTTMLAGSTFQEDIDGTTIGNGAGHYSHLEITGGQFIINDNVTLAPQLRGITGSANNTFTPSVGDLFRIVTADGGVVGRFDTLTQPASGLAADTRFTAFYNMRGSNSVDLALTPTSYAAYLRNGRGNVNAQSAGGVLDKLLTHQDDGSATATQSELLYAVAGVSGGAMPDLARRLSGEVHGALAAAAPQAGRALQNQVAGRLGSTAAIGNDLSAEQDLWLDVSTSRGDFDADEYASGYRTKRDQYTLGRDLYGNGATKSRLGAGVSYARNHVTADAGSGSVDATMAFVYGQVGAGDFIVDGIAAYGYSRWKTQRSDPLQQAGVFETAANGKEALLGVGVRLPLEAGGMSLEPFARALWQQSRRDGAGEGTASAAALSLQDYSANGSRVLAGLSGGSPVKDPLADSFTYQFSVAVGRDIGDEGQPAVQARLAGERLTVVAPRSGRDFVQASLNGTVQLDRRSYAYFGLNGEVGSGRSEFGATAGLRIRF